MLRCLIISICCIALVFPFSTPVVVHAAPAAYQLSPQIPLDCGVDAYNPYRSGSTVYGKGDISCLTAHSSLKVVVEVLDTSGGHGQSVTNTCYSASKCTATATESYTSGRGYYTATSGYYYNQNLYIQSSVVYP